MGWTTPRTFVTDELVTASMLNSHVRDNFNAVPHLLAYKTADQSVTSSTTLVNDTHLLAAMAASDLWYFKLVLYLIGDAPTPSAKLAFTVPTSATLILTSTTLNTSGALTLQKWTSSGGTDSVLTSTGGTLISIEGIVETAATAGDFQLQFAQNTSSATAVQMKKSSALFGLQLA